MEKNEEISYEEFTKYIETYYLQSLRDLKEMDEEDGRCCRDDREGIMLNTEENIMTNINMIIEDIDVKKLDKIWKD